MWPATSACTESLEPEEIFSQEPQVLNVAMSPNEDRAAILGIYDKTLVLIDFNTVSGESRIVGHFKDFNNFGSLFASGNSLILVRGRIYDSPSGIIYPRYRSPLVVDHSETKSRLLFQSGGDAYYRLDDEQPFLGFSDDRKQFYFWAYSARKETGVPRGKSVVAAASPDSSSVSVIAAVHPLANTVFVGPTGLPVASIELQESGHAARIWSQIDGDEKLVYDGTDSTSSVFVFGLTPQRDGLVVEIKSDSADWQCCYEMSLSNGSLSGPIYQREGKPVQVLIVDHRGLAIGVKFEGPYPEYEFHDPDLTRRVQEIQARYAGSAVHVADLPTERQSIVVEVTGVHSAGEFLKFPKGSLEPTLLARTMPKIPTEYLSPTDVIHFKAKDGTASEALLTVRDDARHTGKAPLIAMPASISWYQAEVGFDPLVQYLAFRGYAVLQQRARRIKVGFAASDLEQYITWLWQDLDSAVQSLVSADIVDPDRVCIVGDSYSAHTAFSAAAFSEFEYKCVVSIDGILDLGTPYKSLVSRDRTVFGVFKRMTSRFSKGGKRIRELSPLANADKIDSSVLLINGEDSRSESISQSTRMYVRLVADGKDVRWLDIEGEDGTWLESESLRQVFLAINRFVGPRIARTANAEE